MVSPMSFLRRHTGPCIAGGVLVAAVAAGGISYAATSGGTSSTAAASPTTTAPAQPAPQHDTSGRSAGSGSAHKGHHGVRGTITAIDGSTWTLKTAKGKVFTVDVSSSTAYGTKKSPATASSFAVGSQATVTGQRSGTTVTATRIIVPLHPAGAPSSSSGGGS